LKFFSIQIATVDVAFTGNSTTNNGPYLIGCSILEEPIDPSLIKNTIISRINISPYYIKLQKVLKTSFGIDYWSLDKSFDVRDHIEIIEEIKTRDELCAFMSLHASEIELDPKKPKWKIFIIEKFEYKKSAIVLKIDHIYGDGLSVLSFYLNMGMAENVKFVTLPKFNKLLLYMLYPLGIIKAFIWANKLVNKTKRDKNRYNELKITGKRHAFCSNALDLKKCKEYSKGKGVSINEVLLSLTIRCFQNYHQKKFNEPLNEFKIFISSSLRAVSNKLEFIPMENQSNFVILDQIPASELTFSEFLKKIHLDTQYLLKTSLDFYYRAFAGEFSYSVMPKAFNLKIINQLTRNISCVFTNVPGPLEKIKLYNKTVGEMFFFTGGMNEAGLITTILSYHGNFHFSCSADESYRINVKDLVEEFENLFKKEIC
jgi:hypothetical protein